MGRSTDDYGLTPRQAAAVEHYMLHGSLTDAYRHAYSVSRMKPDTINRNAIRLFQVPQVAARVQALRAEMDAKSSGTREEALSILWRIARGELSRYLDERGHIRADLLKDAGPALESYQEDQHSVGSGDDAMIVVARKLKVRNPIQAIERIAHMCGWDKQSALMGEGVIINLNMGGPE